MSGAGSGIGRAVARKLFEEGAGVALFGRTLAKLEETRGETPASRAPCIAGSHENPADVRRVISNCERAFGRLDILVNNAGEYLQATAAETSPEDWSRIFAVNLTGPYLLTREALPLLRKSKGSIVNVSSTLGIKPVSGVAAYAAAKAGLIQLTRSLALEEAANGVRSNVVCPGVVDTPIHAQRTAGVGDGPSQFLEAAARLHPLGRVGQAEEVAAMVLFLLSDESAWTTGAVITVDGGISLA